METSGAESRTDRLDRVLDLIGAVANQEAFPQDIVAQLRSEGFDALDVVVAALAGAARESASPRSAMRPIDVRTFSQPTPPELTAQTVHQVPKAPFVLNGTLYDPKDINRFDGRELHFIDVRGQLVAFDERNTIARVWELLYILPDASPPDTPAARELSHPVGGDMGPAPWPWWPDVDEDVAGAYFYSDSGYEGWGSELFLRKNYGYWDLTEVCRGFLCSDDWNDCISAMRCHRTWQTNEIVVLHEHINMQGSTFTNSGPSGPGGGECFGLKELDSFGWNDHTSSVETW